MKTVELTENLLKSRGWAYLFDLSEFDGYGDEAAVAEQIRDIYLSVIAALESQRSKKLKGGPLVIWNCLLRLADSNNQATDGYALIVTPFYQEITGRDSDPVADSMRRHRGYLRTISAIPLMEGASPSCLFAEGQAHPIELDEKLINWLADMFEDHQYMFSLMNPNLTLR